MYYREEETNKIENEEEEQVSGEEATPASIEDDLKSPNLPEYSHLPPDPTESDKCDEGKSLRNNLGLNIVSLIHLKFSILFIITI